MNTHHKYEQTFLAGSPKSVLYHIIKLYTCPRAVSTNWDVETPDRILVDCGVNALLPPQQIRYFIFYSLERDEPFRATMDLTSCRS